MWGDVLGCEEIGIFDNFFALGGHSLSAVKLITRIQNRFEVKIPLSALFSAQTIAGMADFIRHAIDHDVWTPLVPMQPAGDKPPLFCVHTGFGLVLVFVELMRRLEADRPFYGIQAVGLEEGQQPVQSMEAMADLYIRQIRRVQPAGPYHLMGHCFGGLVAYAMAQRLREQGEEVAFLGMMDTLNTNEVVRSLEGMISVETMFYDVLLGNLSKRVKKRFRKLSAQEQAEMVYDRIKDDAKDIGFELPDIDVGMVRRVLDLLQINTKVALNYRIEPYPGKITYFVAQDEKRDQPIVTGWPEMASEGIDIIEVPGDHYGMLMPPHVGELAQAIARQLDE